MRAGSRACPLRAGAPPTLGPATRTRVTDSRVFPGKFMSLSPGEVRGAAPKGYAVTRDHARKKAIRARMAASGEPYSVAARALAASEPADLGTRRRRGIRHRPGTRS